MPSCSAGLLPSGSASTLATLVQAHSGTKGPNPPTLLEINAYAFSKNYNGTISQSAVTAEFGASFAADVALAQSLVPEPTTLLAGTLGLGGLIARRRRAI